jgi:hypothetical protein
VLVRAYRNPPSPIWGWSAEDRRKLDEGRSKEERDLNKRAEVLAAVIGGRPGTRLVDADATLALLQVAEEGKVHKTLLAVGSRGLGAIGRARLERVMNLGGNRIGMRIPQSVWFPHDLCFRHS